MADLDKDLDLEVDGEGGEIGEAATLSVDDGAVVDAEETVDTSAEDLEVAARKTELSQGDLSGFSSGFPAGWTLTTAKVDDLLKKLISERHPSKKG